MAQDLSGPLWVFVRANVDSFASWDLLVFFADRSHQAEERATLARYLARPQLEVDRALDKLAKVGVLDRAIADGEEVFALTPDPATRSLVDEFVTSTAVRDIRLRVLTHLLKTGAR